MVRISHGQHATDMCTPITALNKILAIAKLQHEVMRDFCILSELETLSVGIG